jgi:hypothetical protein
MGPEAKLYQNVKQNFKQFSLIRLENISLLGTPDLLVCNTSGNFCTVELKVTKGNKLRFSATPNCVPRETSTQYFYPCKDPWSFAQENFSNIHVPWF